MFADAFFIMLTKEDLLVCDTIPNVRNVSLKLYKEFAETFLLGKVFHYSFTDGTDLCVEFTEWGIYHMLCIHHINGRIGGDSFFDKINEGLSFDDFEADNALKFRFKKYKKRITMFACVYNTLINGKVFYIPSGNVYGTAGVQMDYIIYQGINNVSPSGITQNGINIGIRNIKGRYIPLTILISKHSDIEEYIKTEELKIVRKLEIIDKLEN